MILSAEKIIKLAISLEETGEIFYSELLNMFASNSKEAKLLKFLVDQEGEHKKFFENLLKNLSIEKQKEINISESESLFLSELIEGKIFEDIENAKKYLSKDIGTLNILNYALGFEIDSVYFYETIEPNKILPIEKDIIKSIIKAENNHVKLLMEYRIDFKYHNKQG